MLTGIVNVSIETFAGVANSMVITGDNSVHDVVVTSTQGGTPDEYSITSKNGDLFTLNGSGLPTLGPIAVDGVTGNIIVAPGRPAGPNTFDMEAPAKTTAGSVSTVLDDLDIYNFSSQTTIINNTLIQGNLNVIGEANGLMTFDSVGLQVNGVTFIDNENDRAAILRSRAAGCRQCRAPGPFSGDGVTNITNSTFEGLVKYVQSLHDRTDDRQRRRVQHGLHSGFEPGAVEPDVLPDLRADLTQIGYTVGVTLGSSRQRPCRTRW